MPYIMAKLIDDPAVQALVNKECGKIDAHHMKTAKTALATTVKTIKEIVAERAADAKNAGNPGAARYLTSLGADLTARLKTAASA